MSRLVFAAVLALLLAPAGAMAKTFPIPADDPIATISLPDSWEPHDYDGGVEGTSDDGGVYLAVEAVKGKEVGDAAAEGVVFFGKQGVKIDEKSLKTEELKLNGLAAFDMSMQGTDKDGPTEVGMTLVKTNSDDRLLMIYYWGSAKGQKDNAGEIKKIVESLTATK